MMSALCDETGDGVFVATSGREYDGDDLTSFRSQQSDNGSSRSRRSAARRIPLRPDVPRQPTGGASVARTRRQPVNLVCQLTINNPLMPHLFLPHTYVRHPIDSLLLSSCL